MSNATDFSAQEPERTVRMVQKGRMTGALFASRRGRGLERRFALSSGA